MRWSTICYVVVSAGSVAGLFIVCPVTAGDSRSGRGMGNDDLEDPILTGNTTGVVSDASDGVPAPGSRHHVCQPLRLVPGVL